MPTKSSKVKVFSRFYRTVVLVFTLVIFIALALATTRYFREFSHFHQEAEQSMQLQAEVLNDKLSHSVQALSGLLEFANYCLKYPEHVERLLPDLAQDGDYFYLIRPRRDIVHQRTQLSGNITGIGNIKKFDLAMKQELAMANALTPAFITAKHTNPEVTWFYYVSKRRFVHLFPWVSRQSWQYSDRLIEREYFVEIQKRHFTDEFYWSPPYQDSAGKGLTASVAAGVKQKGEFVGALVIDINLNNLYQSLPNITAAEQGYLLIDQNQRVLLHKSTNETTITANTKWQEVVPSVFGDLNKEQLQSLVSSQHIGEWFIQKQTLPINNWVLIKYQPYNDFIAPLAGQFVFWFFVLFSGLVAFIVLIYWLTNKTFIKPASEFIQHIENCAKGDSGKIKPTPDWRHWFHVVEDIFSQNRSLMQQLKDKNAELDKRVKEKTYDLLKTSEQHQRDYALLRSVMNAMPELIIFSDPQGKLIGCNSALEKFIGEKERQLLGKSACQLLPEQMCQALAELSIKAYQDENRKAYQQVVKTTAHTFELFSRRFFNEDKKPLGTINIFRDVTEAYAVQAALEQAKTQAEQANQAKGQFLANMSHEIRTPINAIQGMMYLLAKTRLNKAQLQYLKNAETASQSLLYLIDELLDLAKIEAGKMPILLADTVVDEIIDKALKLNIGAAHKKDLPIYVDIAVEVPRVIHSDEIRLVQVLTNLINNAVKFTAEGKVSVSVDLIEVDNNTHIQFTVKDTGIGIAKEKQQHLFNAFTQADESMTRKYGGSGLGLSICQQIVQLLGGSLHLKSELAEGSEFCFSVPINASLLEQHQDSVTAQRNIVAFNTLLPQSLIAKFAAIGWQYHYCNDEQQLLKAAQEQACIVLIEAELLVNNHTLLAKLAEHFNSIGICLPMLAELDENLNQALEDLSIPWAIIEKPYYRAVITQILQISPSAPTSARVSEEPQGDLSGIKVLLVEDNLVNQMVAQELLKSMQADVVIANNGQEAIELLTQHKIDVVLMDIQMPVMDGLTATKKIRTMEKYQHLPIIAMTAHARAEDHQQSLAAGMNKHIAKPVTYQVLFSTIKAVI